MRLSISGLEIRNRGSVEIVHHRTGAFANKRIDKSKLALVNVHMTEWHCAYIDMVRVRVRVRRN